MGLTSCCPLEFTGGWKMVGSGCPLSGNGAGGHGASEKERDVQNFNLLFVFFLELEQGRASMAVENSAAVVLKLRRRST